VTSQRFVVVGGGIVGLATAREISRRAPDARVTVLEKESAVALHQSSHNSGVVHAGLYYEPGSLKARLCVRGKELLRQFCAEHGVAYEECGKVVVARRPAELAPLRAIQARAEANQVPGIRWLGPEALAQIEPEAAGVAALHSPHTAIVDYAQVARAMAVGVDVRLGFEVTSIRPAGHQVVLGPGATPGYDAVVADRVVLCAGLQADRVARLAGDQAGPAIVAFRGEYWRLPEEHGLNVRGLIYPVPDPSYPFLGVHFTRRIGGAVDIGPNAVLALAREGYRRRDIRPAELASTLMWPGFRAMARQHWRAGLHEFKGSTSRKSFLAEAATLVPAVAGAEVVRAPTGVRAQAVDVDGTLLDDFRISRVGDRGQILAVRNAPSPAATSSLAIAEHIVDQMGP
jgi:L-2-hydroxyglutarate oxidase LhgO